MLSTSKRKMVVWALVMGWLLGLSLRASDSRPVVGRVVASSGVTLEGVPIPNEGTMLTGDLLMTPKGGTALVEFSSTTQANIAEETSVRFAYAGSNPLAQISSGTMVTMTQRKDVLIVETPKYRIEPGEQGKAIHVVAVLPDESTVVAARSGGVSITEISSGLRYVLPEGKYAAIPASSTGVPGQAPTDQIQSETSRTKVGTPTAPAAGQGGGGTAPKGRGGWHIGPLSHKASIIALSATAGAAAAFAITRAGRRPASPSKP